MNPETVREERDKGEPIFFGDATQEPVLEVSGLKRARVLVIVINDAAAVRRITEMARRLNPKIYTIVRTRFMQEVQPLYELGADEVIPEEFETAVEIFTRVLKKYLFPKDQIEKFTAEGLIRESLVILEESTGQQYRFGMPGPEFQKQEREQFLDALSAVEPTPDYLVASGSLPPGVPADFYARVACVGKDRGAKVIIDVSGATPCGR